MRRLAAAVAVAAVLLLSGCGIPDSTDVKVLGNGQSAGPAQDLDAPPPAPVTRSSTNDITLFIGNYLKAAAGDPDRAVQQAKEFMDPGFAASFKPSTTDIAVVRPTEQPLVNSGNPHVSLNVEQVGTLKQNGELVPLPHPGQTEPLHFTISKRDPQGLFIAKADPPVLMISVDALTTYYQQHTIYFWNNDNTGLIPDVRYMPLSVPSAQQPTVILNWLAAGPADWLPPAAVPLPQNAAPPPDNIPAISNDELQIKLNSQGPTWDAAALDRLAQQLQWSLRPLAPKTLELTVGHQNPVKFSGEQNTPDANPASRLVDEPERFVVYNGVIRRLSESSHAVNQVPVLKPAANKGVQSAAMSSDGGQTLAAVVSTVGKDKTPALRVAAASGGEETDLRAVGGLRGTLGHPAWVATAPGAEHAIGLITADNHLFSFDADGSSAQPVEWQQGGDPGPISGFSVAPDGHRIALAAGGRLYRAVLTVGSDGVVVMSSPALIDTPGLHSISAVAWSSEAWLVAAGVNNNRRVSIYDVSIDGSQSAPRLDDIGDEPITFLTAYPINPLLHSQLSDAEVAYIIDGAAGIAAGYPLPIKTSDLAGPATASSSAPAVLTSPFFLN